MFHMIGVQTALAECAVNRTIAITSRLQCAELFSNLLNT
jgi:hypothetical protein